MFSKFLVKAIRKILYYGTLFFLVVAVYKIVRWLAVNVLYELGRLITYPIWWPFWKMFGWKYPEKELAIRRYFTDTRSRPSDITIACMSDEYYSLSTNDKRQIMAKLLGVVDSRTVKRIVRKLKPGTCISFLTVFPRAGNTYEYISKEFEVYRRTPSGAEITETYGNLWEDYIKGSSKLDLDKVIRPMGESISKTLGGFFLVLELIDDEDNGGIIHDVLDNCVVGWSSLDIFTGKTWSTFFLIPVGLYYSSHDSHRICEDILDKIHENVPKHCTIKYSYSGETKHLKGAVSLPKIEDPSDSMSRGVRW